MTTPVSSPAASAPLVTHSACRLCAASSLRSVLSLGTLGVSGFINADAAATSTEALWIWNLASEGKTIESDVQWLPLLHRSVKKRQ